LKVYEILLKGMAHPVGIYDIHF